MIVIMILSVLTAVAMPRMKGVLAATRLKTSTRDVSGMLRMARDFAVLREKPVEVRFDVENDTYKLVLLDREYKEEEPDKRSRVGRKDKQPLRLNDDVAGMRVLPKGVHFQAIYTAAPLSDERDLPRVIFYSDGAASPATLLIQNDNRGVMSIEVFRTTGLTRVAAQAPAEEPAGVRKYYGPETKR
jgi:type II secretory pathway pseudopilin PulG